MGYYVHAITSTAEIPACNLDAAYAVLCELNAHNDLKIGGHYGTPTERPADSKSVSTDPDRWFSWMPWNYDELCHNAAEVLDLLGFYTDYTPDGSLKFYEYDQKTGQEELFIRSIAHLVRPGTYIRWIGEDDELWEWVFNGTGMDVVELVGDVPY